MSSEQVLSGSPRMLPLFARAGAALLPGASRLPLVGRTTRGTDVPDRVLVLDGVRTDRARLAAYDRVCGFPLRDQLPVTYPHILAFPLHLALMTDPAFPFPALGLVHIENMISQHRPITSDEALSLRVSATALEPHPRGTAFNLRTEARVGQELVWEGASRILKRGPTTTGPGTAGGEPGRAAEGQTEPSDGLPVTATWRLPGDLGRRYASVSGDLNPIHLHPLSARLLGFSSAIAHGMWTKARCLAALAPDLPDRLTVHVSFRKPILLPASVQFAERSDGEGIRFSVTGAGRDTRHLDGTVRAG